MRSSRYIYKMVLAISTAFIISAIGQAASFEFTPTESGSLFWRSTPAYAPDKLVSRGSYGRTSRILLKYDLSKTSPEKFGSIEKATLILNINELKNAGNLPLYTGAICSPWETNNISFIDSTWPKGALLKRYMRDIRKSNAKKGYFEHAWEAIPRATVIPETQKDSTLEIDVSHAIEDIIFQGVANNGFTISMGGKCFGEAGITESRHLSLKNPPVLKIELCEVIPEASKEAQRKRTLRYFPSALLPPVSDPYIFLWCAFVGDHYKLFWDVFETMNTEGVYAKPELFQRGILSLQAVNGPNQKWVNSEEAALRNYTHPLGIAIDEWNYRDKVFRTTPEKSERSDQGTRVDHSISALRKIRKADPEQFIAVYWRGEECLKELLPDATPDIILPELYTRFPGHPEWALGDILGHVRWAEHDGFLDRIIPLYGIVYAEGSYPGTKARPSNIESYEAEIQTMRKAYPQIAGAGFFVSKGDSAYRKENGITVEQSTKALLPIAKELDELVHKYYVEPAPEIQIDEPYFNKIIDAYHIRIVANATPKNDTSIEQYRYFIDNRLVAESKDSSYIFDCRGIENGFHTLTVHVIDSKWNRSAAQIPIRLNLKGEKR